jgi:hypothetical protein
MSYTSLMLPTSPLLYLPGNDAAGATALADASGHGNTSGTLPTGATLGAPGLIPGETDTALALDGTATVGLPNLALSAPFVLSLVVNPRGDAGVNKGLGTLLGYSTTRRLLWSDSSNVLEAQMGAATLVSSVALPANTSHHVAYRADGTTETLFLDGVNVASQPNTAASWNAASWLGGYAAPGGSYQLKGTVEKVAVHNTALSDAAIQSLAAAALTPVTGSNGVMAYASNGTNYVPAVGVRVFVGSQQPTGGNPGDIWLQTS